ncbi:hypothetical protein BZA77DRAFT_321777 [Pyronema omphalodes]|nr:hypothetical protein BZA77DRAFT_321777 [Pyronema omphalodes]
MVYFILALTSTIEISLSGLLQKMPIWVPEPNRIYIPKRGYPQLNEVFGKLRLCCQVELVCMLGKSAASYAVQ